MDEIIKGKDVCVFNLIKMKKEYDKEFDANDKRRIEHNIKLKVLSNPAIDKIPLAKIKKTKLKGKINVFVYSNKITIFYNDIETYIFTIKIDEITKYFKELFEKEWNN